MRIKPSITDFIKRLIFPNGERYFFKGKKLYFRVGSRPIRRKYINSESDVVRNDVLQIEFLENHFKEDDVLWDIGAHHGHYSIFSASVAKENNQVFSFEPDGVARSVFVKNVELNQFGSRINVYNSVISRSDGDVFFNTQGGNANSHIIKNVSSVSHGDVQTMQSRSIDSLTLELPRPSFVKIDTEGAEIDILKGAEKLLAIQEITFICELHPFAWDRFNVKFSDLTDMLTKYDRKIRLLDPKKSLNDLPFYGTVLF